MTKLIFFALFAYFLWFGADMMFKEGNVLWFLGGLAVANTFAVLLFQSYLADAVRELQERLGVLKNEPSTKEIHL